MSIKTLTEQNIADLLRRAFAAKKQKDEWEAEYDKASKALKYQMTVNGLATTAAEFVEDVDGEARPNGVILGLIETVAGRRTLDTDAMIAAGINLEPFYKKGADTVRLTMKHTRN